MSITLKVSQQKLVGKPFGNNATRFIKVSACSFLIKEPPVNILRIRSALSISLNSI